MRTDGCLAGHSGASHELRANLGAALRDLRLKAEVRFRTVTCEEAVSLRVTGSSTVRIDGRDIATGGSRGIACRSSPDGSGGYRNAPTAAYFRKAIGERPS